MDTGTIQCHGLEPIVGVSIGAVARVRAEMVFTTGMTGYIESLTDPSFRGQILVFTNPLIGNYGVPDVQRDRYGLASRPFQSDHIQVAGVIMGSAAATPVHYSSRRSLAKWLAEEGIPALEQVDTRQITQWIRRNGSRSAVLTTTTGSHIPRLSDHHPELLESVQGRHVYTNKSFQSTILIIDCGAKHSLLQAFLERNCRVIRVSAVHDLSSVTDHYDAVVVSNGPGDPRRYKVLVRQLRTVMDRRIPLLGICLGHQLIALSAGMDVVKLPYGHRSLNQPCLNTLTQRAVLTAQNHGFAVKDQTMPPGWLVWYRNLNDGVNEGIRHRTLPFWGVQFHPEGQPGPEDSVHIFDDFLRLVNNGV